MLSRDRSSLAGFGRTAAVVLVAAGCAGAAPAPSKPETVLRGATVDKARFERDRKAILAMAGDFDVTFDFRETVALTPGYELKKPKQSGADEIVRLVEDRGEFISLQHILVIRSSEPKIVKHWRQDWQYEPATVLVFIGGNAWEKRQVSPADRAGKWSQTVYQVEDSPRYGAVGGWTHDNGVSQWNPPAEMRPLPRRDMTTRSDYDAVLAVNRHTITPAGWVQEEENSKLVLRGEPRVLAREIGVNTYKRSSQFNVKLADDYWAATKDFWAIVRADWTRLERTSTRFGLTVQGEPEPLYTPILKVADEVQAGQKASAPAAEEAKAVIARLTTTDVGTLAERIEKSTKASAAKASAKP